MNEVDENFPKLVPNMLKEILDNRITSVNYEISLNGIQGTNFSSIDWPRLLFS